jgi:lysophospholipase L1-like esterase
MFLGFLEILARRTDNRAERSHIQMDFDADLMWGLTNDPHRGPEYRVNSLGLRGDDPRDGTVRILTLGDSSIYGHGVALAEVFSSVLAARIDAARPTPVVEGVIGAVPGYSTFQAIRLLDRVGSTIRPSVVIVGSMWSDAYRSAITDAEWSEELKAAYGPWQPVTVPLATLSRHSALARRIRTTIHDRFFPQKEHANEIGWMHLIDGETVGAAPRAGTAPVKDGARSNALPTHRVPPDAYRANLRTLAEKARALGAIPTFLMLPHPIDGKGLDADEQAYRDTMRSVATEENAVLIDGPAWFEAHPGEGRFSDDIHPSAVGHAMLADATLAAFAADPAVAKALGIAP